MMSTLDDTMTAKEAAERWGLDPILLGKPARDIKRLRLDLQIQKPENRPEHGL